MTIIILHRPNSPLRPPKFCYLYLNPFRAENAALVVAVAGGAGAARDRVASASKLFRLCVYRLFTAHGKL